MSVAGLKKQFHKASQLFSEKISGVEGTKLDDEFLDMERKIDITNKAVAEILSKATEYLQPNPAYRAKLGMLNTVSKIRGQVKTTGYPQTEGLLGDCMLKYGKELGEGSTFGNALIEVGESMKLMAEVKDSLDINVKQTFIDPLQLLQDKDLKEIGVEQVSQLAVFVEAALDYHRQSTEILQELQSKLRMRISAASSVPRREYKPRPIKRSPSELNGVSAASTAKTPGSNVPMDQPCCRGLYDFEPENQGELGFKEGDVITLTNQIDENWYEGLLHGESGFFPINYVEVIVPLPQ
ncbi:endophilin-A3 isoform X2 [Mustela nigripes]|uniref:endophilin-A3 isoform X2 n=1 Tax=Mustela lutreola TaxID=9666 RepID=UPI0027970BAC|nr:endophilin-A3 isoform X2 [Mustela lutreola]XP_059227443.1 endophilin-A3 isoform X2 [Mustela nigripes]